MPALPCLLSYLKVSPRSQLAAAQPSLPCQPLACLPQQVCPSLCTVQNPGLVTLSQAFGSIKEQVARSLLK